MNNILPDNIDLDDETLEFDEFDEIELDDDVPEIKTPILDDFLYFIPDKQLLKINLYDFVGFKLFCFLVLREVDAIRELEQKKFIDMQVKSMIPHIARFQRYHLWEENSWGQRVRNWHNVIKDRNIQRHWNK
jgi:hypothetical protein